MWIFQKYCFNTCGFCVLGGRGKDAGQDSLSELTVIKMMEITKKIKGLMKV